MIMFQIQTLSFNSSLLFNHVVCVAQTNKEAKLATIEEVMDQEERVLGEIEELASYIREIRGYLNEMEAMANGMLPNHWDGGDRIDVSGIQSEVDSINMTAYDLNYDVGQIETYTDRLIGAVEDLEGMRDEEEALTEEAEPATM